MLIKIKSPKYLSTVSIFFLFLLMLWSMSPWFAWKYTEIMAVAISGCFLLLRFILLMGYCRNNTITYSLLTAIAFAFLVYLMMRFRFVVRVWGVFNFVRTILVFVFVMLMNKEEKKRIVSIITTIYAWILGISMIAYAIVMLGVDLPYIIIEKPDNLFYPPFRNYGLFIMGSATSVSFLRFQSIFTEPGHLGVISAVFLYINRYELKRKSVLIIFISVLITLSLAAYVLLILGILIYIVAKSKNIIGPLLKVVITTTLLIVIGYYYYLKNPDSIVSTMILSRFELDENKGIRGNNRTRASFDYYYETQFITSTQNILLGKNLNEFEYMVLLGRGGNNSYKVFLLRYGSIALVLLFLLYFSIVAVKPSRLGFGLLLLCCISFLQRTQTPLWEMQLFLFIGAIQYFHTEKNEPPCDKLRGIKPDSRIN